MNLLLSSEVVIDNSFEKSNIYLDYLYVSESYINYIATLFDFFYGCCDEIIVPLSQGIKLY